MPRKRKVEDPVPSNGNKRKATKEKVDEDDVNEDIDEDILRIGTPEYDDDGKPVRFTFKRGNTALRDPVQRICVNFSQRGTPINVASFSDLFFAKPTLDCFLVQEQVISDDDDTSSEETTTKSDEERLLQKIQTKKQAVMNSYGAAPPNVDVLLSWIKKHSKDIEINNKKLKEKGYTSFEGLAELFSPGTLVFGHSIDTGASPIGYRVLYSQYTTQKSFTGKFRSFHLSMELVASVAANTFVTVNFEEIIPQFPGNIPLSNLPIKLMTPELKQKLTERGRSYVKLTSKACYMAYDSESFSLHHSTMNYQNNSAISGSAFLRTTGRVMLDIETGRKLGHFPATYSGVGMTVVQQIQQFHQLEQQKKSNPNAYRYNYGTGYESNEMHEVPESMLCLTWPAITGFSFSAKSWGHVLVESLSEIKFDENSFNQLVLDDDRKKLIKAMVNHSEVVFRDIISGKGGGSVFLLHGPPGTGKTLTAEAVAEMLHRPLYSVTMGELGTTPEAIEKQISGIFELATIWNSLVLFDEADIFLERRGQKEIIRNAMVGVLLRQIEYFQGVLFLTSNRVDVFDEAFHSRVTVGLKYSELDTITRKEVWEMLLSAAGIKKADAEKLSKHVLNGRQIKNCICLAQGLAKAEKTAVKQQHLDKTVAVALEFKEELLKTPNNGVSTNNSNP